MEILSSSGFVAITKLTTEQQNQLLRYLAKQALENKVKIMEINRDIFYPLKQKYSDVSVAVLSYSSLVLAIQKFKNQTSEVDLNAVNIRTKSFRRQPKKDRLIGYWALVKTLRNENNLSFRQIAQYLKKYHKFDISHSVIFDSWSEFETKNTTKGTQDV